MDTPIYDFVKEYSSSGISRLHMPGHKGMEFLGFEKADITEIKGADALYSADGIIAESEKNAASLFGSAATFYSAGGSSQCIKAMLAAAKNGKKDFTVLAARNVHKAFVYACALLDIRVRWIFDEGDNFSLCRCVVTPEGLRNELKKTKADAVYITSPDYLGTMSDIEALSAVAHKNNALMLVDNAHGAYLHFLPVPCHPMDCGADICCDSAHKTLPVLTGGAYLHVKNEELIPSVRRNLEMFGSTSPSYLILQSLDLCNRYIAEGYREKLAVCIARIDALKKSLHENGWQTIEGDPLKLTILSSGINLSERLRQYGIECEYEDPDYTVLMFTPETDAADYERILKAAGLCDAEKSAPAMKMPVPEGCMEIRDALFSKSEAVEIDAAVGRVVADTSVGCPPAVPVLISGEKVTQEAVEIMKYYGIDKITAVI